MLLGRVGADPQKRGSAEHPVVIFSLATHTNYKYETGIHIINLILVLKTCNNVMSKGTIILKYLFISR